MSRKMKKVLVTGGAGFIGSSIVDDLIKQNYEVSIIDNLSSGKKENLNKKAKFYHSDILKGNNIFEIEKPEIVIHCAAQTMLRKSIEDPIYDANMNIIGTINILEECKRNNVKRIIYTSTGGARVGEPMYLPVDEKHPLNPCSPYGASKHSAENYVRMYSDLYGLEYLIFCFGNVYGPRDNPQSNRVIGSFIDKMLKGESPNINGDGNQTRDFIYVSDISEFLVKSIEKNPEHKLFHLANGKQIKINEIFAKLKKILDFKGTANYCREIAGEVRDIVLDTSLAEKELGWSPKHSLDQGLKETLKYFKGK